LLSPKVKISLKSVYCFSDMDFDFLNDMHVGYPDADTLRMLGIIFRIISRSRKCYVFEQLMSPYSNNGVLSKIICYLIIRCLFYKTSYKLSSREWFYICQLYDKINFFFHKTYALIIKMTKNNLLAYPLKI
jgi:hypothetical protein